MEGCRDGEGPASLWAGVCRAQCPPLRLNKGPRVPPRGEQSPLFSEEESVAGGTEPEGSLEPHPAPRTAAEASTCARGGGGAPQELGGGLTAVLRMRRDFS